MLVDISKITLENINDFIFDKRKVTKKNIEKNLKKKEYQHQYYLKVTKVKRKLKNDLIKDGLVEKIEE